MPIVAIEDQEMDHCFWIEREDTPFSTLTNTKVEQIEPYITGHPLIVDCTKQKRHRATRRTTKQSYNALNNKRYSC